ncbi:MAG: DUF4340 domain-containing protein, partial [Verrucomicrobiae bacterium]|nr:DUF4340 domain-containing protein [Verrucomicrobiae bacterium]
MNRKQLTLILAAVVVLGGLGLWVRHSQVAGYRPAAGRMGQKVLGDFDVNETVAVRIVNGTNELDLAKQDGKWTVAERDAYPANFGTISEFIRNLGDLKTAQAVEAGESQLGRLELKAPDSDTGGGMLVELKQADGSTLASLLLGKKHLKKPASPSPMGGDEGWPDGRYVMVPGKLDTLSLVSETFANIEPKPDQWLNKDFFKVQKSKRVSVTWPEATNSWTLARETETGTMTLENPLPGETLDTSKAGSVASALGYPSFNDVSKNNPQVEALFTNAVSVKIETFEGFNYDLKAAKSDSGDDYYLTVTVSAAYPRERTPGADEKPEDNQFYARDDRNEGMLHCNGTLAEPADSVFLRVYADETRIANDERKPGADRAYAFSAKLQPGLIKYRMELGTRSGDRETIVHTATNLVCGDAYLIQGQSNALATDTGETAPADTSDWTRTFGSTAGDPGRARLHLWGNSVWKDNEERLQLGYWGMELARRLVASQHVPI